MRSQTIFACLVLAHAVGIAQSSSCHVPKSGEIVDGKEKVPLQICHPEGVTLNCGHCTHAGSRTSCWPLVSRCLSEKSRAEYKLQNWGINEETGNWEQNFDLTGNMLTVEAVCRDEYGGYCFVEQEPLGSGSLGPCRVTMWRLLLCCLFALLQMR
mmetsp:Transcript_18490/g.34239  ORF Transcript_18490/g.34239 Transcript_18490/m.34239 type:complete len:155 (-) Transcript_18490:1745-2209(-)